MAERVSSQHGAVVAPIAAANRGSISSKSSPGLTRIELQSESAPNIPVGHRETGPYYSEPVAQTLALPRIPKIRAKTTEDQMASLDQEGKRDEATSVQTAHFADQFQFSLGAAPFDLEGVRIVMAPPPDSKAAEVVAKGDLICTLNGATVADVRAAQTAMLAAGGTTVKIAVRKPQNLETRYDIGKELGVGVCGTVHLATSKSDGAKVAIKTVRLSDLTPRILSLPAKIRVELEHYNEELLRREVEVLRIMNHPHACRMLDVFDEMASRQLRLVLELCSGGDLDRVLEARGVLSESEVRNVMRQLCDVCAFMHSKGIIHRDIKPANVMIVAGPPERFALPHSLEMPEQIKLADFGVGRVFVSKHKKHWKGSQRKASPFSFRSAHSPDGNSPTMGLRSLSRPGSQSSANEAIAASALDDIQQRAGSMVAVDTLSHSRRKLSALTDSARSSRTTISDALSLVSDSDASPSAEHGAKTKKKSRWSFVGTPMFRAPEVVVQAEGGSRSADMTSRQAYSVDVYALGQTMRMLLVGEPTDAPREPSGGGGCCCAAAQDVVVDDERARLDALSVDARTMALTMTRDDWEQRPSMKVCLGLSFLGAAPGDRLERITSVDQIEFSKAQSAPARALTRSNEPRD